MVIDKDSYWILLIIEGIALILAIIVYKTSHKNKPPVYILAFTIVSTLCSIIWIGHTASIIISFLEVQLKLYIF